MGTRTEALALAERRKAARRLRTRRLRRGVVALALAAFAVPFATIYEQMAAGRDPALTTRRHVAKAPGTAPAPQQTQTPAIAPAPVQTQVTPAPVQTQQS